MQAIQQGLIDDVTTIRTEPCIVNVQNIPIHRHKNVYNSPTALRMHPEQLQ